MNIHLILDTTLGTKKQVKSIRMSCYYQIRNIGFIRKYKNYETCKTLVQTLIISRLDCGNALLCNIPLSLTNHLEIVSKNISVIYNVKHMPENNHVYMLCCSLILPYLSYACEVRGNTYKSQLHTSMLLQKRQAIILPNLVI